LNQSSAPAEAMHHGGAYSAHKGSSPARVRGRGNRQQQTAARGTRKRGKKKRAERTPGQTREWNHWVCTKSRRAKVRQGKNRRRSAVYWR